MVKYTEEEKQKNTQFISDFLTMKFANEMMQYASMIEISKSFINVVCEWLTSHYEDMERDSRKEEFFQNFNSKFDELLIENEEHRKNYISNFNKISKAKQMLEELKNLHQSE